MDIVFPKDSVEKNASGSWSTSYNSKHIHTLLQQAVERATLAEHEILVSITLAATRCDPLHIFSAFEQLTIGERFFWSRPSEQRALVGAGITTAIKTSKSTGVADAATTWRKLQQRTIISTPVEATPLYTSGPLFFGGFAFDSSHPSTALWQDFPDGLLILPRLLFHCDETNAGLTINTLVQPSTAIEQLVEEISTNILSLNSSMEHMNRQPLEPTNSVDKLTAQNILTPTAWMKQITDAVQMIRQGAFEKVVLARAVQVSNQQQPFAIPVVLNRLRESYPDAYVFAIQRGERYFVGATPERLLCSADGQIQTMALAGSAPRGATAAEDRQLGIALLNSEKNQGEHQVVVAMIQQALEALCSRVWVANSAHLLKLKNIQHLQTPISGDLLPGHSILEAIDDLHPTPAVGGYPRQPALAFIRAHEQLDRGWYAAPIGWIGASGNGEFAVALRSALIDGKQATLFAGCGIMADSNAESEFAESCLKLQVMLRGLGEE